MVIRMTPTGQTTDNPLWVKGTTHGTLGGYDNHKCRCDFCTLAKRQAQRNVRDRYAAEGLADDDPRHGTTHAYDNYRCRCEKCLAGKMASR